MTQWAMGPAESCSSTAPPNIASLRQLAETLQSEGRAKDALLLYEHLGTLKPCDPETLRPLVKMLTAQGRTLDAIEKLSELRTVTADVTTLLGDIQEQVPAAIQCFNERLAAKDLIQAERYASALVALIPRNKALLDTAFSCSMALGQKAKAAKYAETLLQLDAEHVRARTVLAEFTGQNRESEGDIDNRVTLALSPDSETHPLVQLHDVHNAVSAILCRPLTATRLEQAAHLLGSARRLAVNSEPGSEWAGWEKHFRLVLDGVDLDALQGDTPAAEPEPKIGLINSFGKALSWRDLCETAKQLGAKIIFFAAADRAYVDRYAGWYVKSVLKHCDVPFLVVVHVIGGIDQLEGAAESVGIRDKRLIYSGDGFDCAKVANRCFDTPNKPPIVKPIAHLQSIRFLRLRSFLRRLKLPVFVSDIDILLQRGIKDLLERCKDADIVLNENERNTNAGSRLTANLVLAKPTANTDLFLRFLGGYLERQLSKPEVTRWIDQLALLLARHHLMRKEEAARIDYFDTTRDINNVIYKSYQENPFRFLSLYHGFDMSSLNIEPQDAKEKPVRNSQSRRHGARVAAKKQRKRK